MKTSMLFSISNRLGLTKGLWYIVCIVLQFKFVSLIMIMSFIACIVLVFYKTKFLNVSKNKPIKIYKD